MRVRNVPSNVAVQSLTARRLNLSSLLMVSTMLSAAALICSSHAQAQQTQSAQQSFSIPAQSLNSAIDVFSRQTGWQVIYPSALAQGRRSNAVQGSMSPSQALTALTSGSGLSLRITGGRSAALVDPGAAAVDTVDGDAIQLETIDVSGGKGPGDPYAVLDDESVYEVPASVAHVSREALDRRAGTSIGDIFRTTPSVIASDQRNSASLDVNIRGVQGMNRNSVRVDGAVSSTPVYRGYYGVSNRTYVDPDLLSGVDISMAPGSGPYGAGSIGGTINMRTISVDDILLEGKDYGFRVTAGAGTNSVTPPEERSLEKRIGAPGLLDFGSFNGSVAFAKRFENIDLVMAVAKRKQGNYFTGKHGSNRVENWNSVTQQDELVPMTQVPKDSEAINTQRDVLSALFKLKGNWGDGHSAEFNYMLYDSSFGEVMPSQVSRFIWDTVEQQEPNWAKMHRASLSWGWNPSEMDLVDLKVNVWGTYMDHATRAGQDFVWDPSTNFRALFPITSKWLGGEVTNVSRFETAWGPTSLTLGGSFTREETTPERDDSHYPPPNGIRNEYSVFAQGSWAPTEALNIRGGVRYTGFDTYDRVEATPAYPNLPAFCDYYGFCNTELDGGGITKNIGLSYKLGEGDGGAFPALLDGVTVFANYDEGFRGPSLHEATFKYAWLPNPYVKPERSQNIELGASYISDSAFLDGDKLMLKAAYFRNDIKDYIVRQSQRIDPRTGQPYAVPMGGYLPWNIGKARFHGIELMGSYDAGGWFASGGLTKYVKVNFCGLNVDDASYQTTYNSGCVEHSVKEDYSSNQIVPEINAHLTVGARFLEEKLTVGATVTHVGKRAAPVDDYSNGIVMPIRRWNPYTTLDLFAAYEINEQARINFSAENVTNQFYMDGLGLAAIPAPGRTIKVGLETKF